MHVSLRTLRIDLLCRFASKATWICYRDALQHILCADPTASVVCLEIGVGLRLPRLRVAVRELRSKVPRAQFHHFRLNRKCCLIHKKESWTRYAVCVKFSKFFSRLAANETESAEDSDVIPYLIGCKDGLMAIDNSMKQL